MADNTLHITDIASLVRACIDGDRIAQRKLYDLHVDYMMITCLRYIADREDAKEIMLDGFCNIYKNLDRFENRAEGSLRAWMKKIMINQCLMYLRRSNRLIVKDEANITDEASDTDDIVSRMSAKEIIEQIQKLPAGYRTVFNLYVLEGMAHNEIASLLGITESTSKTQLRKARLMLQQQIKKVNKIS